MTDYFHYKNHELFVENVRVSDIADHFGTPCYIYSRAALENNWKAFNTAFGDHPHRICFSVKACSNLAILNVLAKLGSGFDIVSVGELERVLKAGGKANQIIFSGVGKRADEIKRALELGIFCFNIESAAELQRIHDIAKTLNLKAPIALRVNPDVDAKTHPHISTGLKENKFGIDFDEALEIFQKAASLPHVSIKGIGCHIGSQLTSIEPFLEALNKILMLINTLKKQNISLEHIDMGGGLGIAYSTHQSLPTPQDLIQSYINILKNNALEIIIEPGRSIAGNAGILLSRVEYLKNSPHKHFAIVDAAMNDLLRPALYHAKHTILPVKQDSNTPSETYDVVGPICETADCFAQNQSLAIQENDLIAFLDAGAYGAVMSSNYNARPRAAEVMVDGDQMHLIRRRETIEDLFAMETML